MQEDRKTKEKFKLVFFLKKQFPKFTQEPDSRVENRTLVSGVPDSSFLFTEVWCALDNFVALVFELV